MTTPTSSKPRLPLIKPEPFAFDLEAMPLYKKLMSGFTLCGECERCERSVVYLTPREQKSAIKEGIRLYGGGGAVRINREHDACGYYNKQTHRCDGYSTRPLICRLFPIDLLEREDDDNRLWWSVFEGCEEVARGKLKGRIPELKKLARQIDKEMPRALKLAYASGDGDWVAEPEFVERKIHYLVPATL